MRVVPVKAWSKACTYRVVGVHARRPKEEEVGLRKALERKRLRNPGRAR